MTLPLDVRHHQQDTFDSCGRACAQMVIGFERARLGIASGTPLPDQTTDMANLETGTLGNWYTDPWELAAHINRGLQAWPDAKFWRMVEFKPGPGVTGDAANVQVASALFDLVLNKLNAGFPTVLLFDSNDHWETAYNWGMRQILDSSGGVLYVAVLYTVNPLPALVAPLGTPHSASDACARYQHTIWLFNSTNARALVCDAEPFVGSAIGITQTDPSDWWSGGPVIDRGLDRIDPRIPVAEREIPATKPVPNPRFIDERIEAWKERAAINEFNVRDPLPPLDTNLPLIAVMTFFKRDMPLIIDALAGLPEAASYSDFDWSRVIVRHATHHKYPDRKMAIAAAPPSEGKQRSILVSIDHRGAVDALHLTSSQAMVTSLAGSPDNALWIMPRHSRWLPFVRIGGDGPSARFRRLFDGFEIELPSGGREHR